jgi:aldehyde:ferredoxin oxidoreductase
MVYNLAIYNAVKFSMVLCDFWPLSLERMTEIMTMITGKVWTEPEMNAVAERVINIARAFNQREGFNRKDDTMPKRLANEALKSGAAAGQKIPQEAFEDMLDQYYTVLGWSKDGMVPDNILCQL